jgi:hypothetical protein
MKTNLLFILSAFLFPAITNSQPCLPDGITFSIQAEIDNFQTNYPTCTQVQGNVRISGNDITNLTGLSVLTSIIGNLEIGYYDNGYHYNPSLVNLNGLENITTVGGSLYIMYNDALLNIAGLGDLTSIGQDLDIRNNYSLSSLNGLNKVISIGGYLYIGVNHSLKNLIGLGKLDSIGGSELHISSDDSLQSLTGLENLTYIGGEILITENPILTSLKGIDNIDSASIMNLDIHQNPLLSNCEVKSVCNYLKSPTGTVTLFENADGCNTQKQITDKCNSIGVPDIIPESNISIYPCPAKNEIFISCGNGTEIHDLSIYNQFGQTVLQQRDINSSIDVSFLPQGIYFILLTTDKSEIRGKVIIE